MRAVKAIWAWLNANSNALTIVFAAAAGLWVLVEIYYFDPARERREATIRYENIFNDASTPIYVARSTLDQFWTKNSHLTDGKRVPIECYPQLAQAALGKVDHSPQIIALHGFYENVSRCVLDGYCDKTRTCATFGAAILDFRWTYSLPLNEWGSGQGRSLDVFLTRLTDMCEIKTRISLDKACASPIDPAILNELRS